jgi:hypothetical protein
VGDGISEIREMDKRDSEMMRIPLGGGECGRAVGGTAELSKALVQPTR